MEGGNTPRFAGATEQPCVGSTPAEVPRVSAPVPSHLIVSTPHPPLRSLTPGRRRPESSPFPTEGSRSQPSSCTSARRSLSIEPGIPGRRLAGAGATPAEPTCIARRTPLAPVQGRAVLQSIASLRVCGPVGAGSPAPVHRTMKPKATNSNRPCDSTDPRNAISRIENAEDEVTRGIEHLHGEGGRDAAAEQKLLAAYEQLEEARKLIDDRGDE